MSESLTAVEQRLRARLDAAAHAHLFTPDPSRTLRELALAHGGIVAAFAVAAAAGGAWAWPLAFLVIGSCQYRLFVLGHDGLHGSLHPDPKTNDRIARWLVYAPLGVGLDDSRRHHLRHHELLGTPADPERYLYGLENKNSARALLLLCSGMLTFARTIERVVPFRDWRSARAFAGSLRQRLPVLLAAAVLVAALVALGLPWWSYFVLWLAPILLLVFVPDEVRSFCDHAVLGLPDAAVDHARLVTYRPGAIERVLLAPLHVGYQAEHHLFPRAPHWALPDVYHALGPCAEVTVRRGYFAFLHQAFAAVPLPARGGGPAPAGPDEGPSVSS